MLLAHMSTRFDLHLVIRFPVAKKVATAICSCEEQDCEAKSVNLRSCPSFKLVFLRLSRRGTP
jgi:hypothetical protein